MPKLSRNADGESSGVRPTVVFAAKYVSTGWTLYEINDKVIAFGQLTWAAFVREMSREARKHKVAVHTWRKRSAAHSS